MKNSYLIKGDHISMRLDRWIKKSISDIPQSLIEKNIRKGNIKINNKKKKSSYKLKKTIKLSFTILIFLLKNIKNKAQFTYHQKRIYLFLQTLLLKITKTLLL